LLGGEWQESRNGHAALRPLLGHEWHRRHLLDHTWNFELRLFGGCFDGGLLLASIDGGAFSPITAMTGGTGYRGAITTSGGSASAGQNAFCGFPNNTQGSMVTSSFFTTLAAGTQVQFAFEGPDRRDDGATGTRQGGLVRME